MQESGEIVRSWLADHLHFDQASRQYIIDQLTVCTAFKIGALEGIPAIRPMHKIVQAVLHAGGG